MSILENTDLINAILAELADREIVENPAEPIDCADCDPWDYLEATNLWDEMYPEPLDANDLVW